MTRHASILALALAAATSGAAPQPDAAPPEAPAPDPLPLVVETVLPDGRCAHTDPGSEGMARILESG